MDTLNRLERSLSILHNFVSGYRIVVNTMRTPIYLKLYIKNALTGHSTKCFRGL